MCVVLFAALFLHFHAELTKRMADISNCSCPNEAK
jgi:hypothetical protein